MVGGVGSDYGKRVVWGHRRPADASLGKRSAAAAGDKPARPALRLFRWVNGLSPFSRRPKLLRACPTTPTLPAPGTERGGQVAAAALSAPFGGAEVPRGAGAAPRGAAGAEGQRSAVRGVLAPSSLAMSDKVSINLDKILVKLASQIEKNRSAKEHVDHQINLYTAKITEKKNKIACLEENIKKGNEALVDLQKQNESSKKHCDAWKPTYAILKKHGEYVKNEIKAFEEATENERKIYEDSITQCRTTLEEHRKKYTETALAQKYYQKKEEVEEIQKRILKHLEKYKWKGEACLDILEAVPFTSINDWAVHIASMRKKTQETLQLAETAAQETIKLEKEAEELQMKTDCLKESFKETKEDQNNSKKIEGKNQKSLEKPEEFQERVFEEREQPSLPKGKHQLYKTLHVPCIPRKFVQSVQSFRFSKQRPETGKEEKEKSVELSVATSSSSSLAENLSQMVIGTAGTKHPQTAQVPSIVSIKNQVKFRRSDLPKQLTSNQHFESENAVMASQEAKHVDEEADEHMDCSYVPQDVHTGFKPNEDNPDTEEESAEPFLRAPKTPDLKGKNPHFSRTPLFDSIQNLGCEEGTSKSPAFFSHMNFSQKSPGFNLFDSSLFGAQNSSDETEENFSVGNLNPLSPHEDIGSFFGKPENEDAFVFPFPSESTSHAFGDGKDDVSFSFAFGQDQRSSQSPSMKGFHSSTQNTKPFTFF
ncbi:protein SIX6OS1 [Motacilla alba alba]|uniref:protein SIX6OS1 n=1 Tax=Motacilla alba alba TaxID=1094192 RepID=UPI0018D56C6A|nr:protein SIX6OS1 [Motacilla alba alba]